MTKLEALFRIQDKYTATINKIMGSTDAANKKIASASGSTDKLNTKLSRIRGAASSGANGLNSLAGSLKGLVGAYLTFQGIQKGMDIADVYTNTAARLSLINDGLQTNAELQDKIFAAANRSRGSYTDMAASVAKMGILAKDAFGSNDELIAFTELVQKSFKVGGASGQEQSAGLYQLTQAMASGRLQGDEFRSIMENAPMIANAIAKFTGKSQGELREMSAEGTITADIIKNAMFAMSGDINSKFATMPSTFGDIFTQISNKSLKAFEPVIQRLSGFINSPEFIKALDSVVRAIDMIAAGLIAIMGFVQSNWSIIEPILIAILGALALMAFVHLPIILLQWLAINWPILLIGSAIALLIYLMIEFSDVTAEVFGYIGGGIGVLVALIFNMVAAVFNGIMYLGDFVANLFIDIINGIIGGINLVISGLNNLPGVNIGLVGEVQQIKSAKLDYMDLGQAWTKGQDIGKSVGGSLGGLGEKLSGLAGSTGIDAYMNNGALPVTGKGGGNLKVDMSKEDLKYLQDIAEREYINKFSTATLAPTLRVSIGKVTKEVDIDKLIQRAGKILREEVAMVAEGAYEL